ncbi:MAG: class I SAM-dependent methyltransferase [Planctomycetota bacterium]
MSFYERSILPRIIDLGMRGGEIAAERKEGLAGVRGRVLEVGFGSGLNLEHYPCGPGGVARLSALDPNDVAWKLARRRIARAPFPVERLELADGRLPAEDASFDSVVTTFTLCTIPDLPSALAEMRRVLAPNGRFHFVEHGLADDERVRKWQRRWNPWQMRLCGGCHVDRAIDREIESAGFRIERLEKGFLKGPKALAFRYRGIAVLR